MPDHRQRQYEDEEVGDEIHGPVCKIRLALSDAMAGGLRLPVFVNRSAAEDHCQNVGEKIAEDKEHDCPGAVFESFVYSKEAEIEEKDRRFIQP